MENRSLKTDTQGTSTSPDIRRDPRYFSGLELSPTDHGLELSPAEKVYTFDQPPRVIEGHDGLVLRNGMSVPELQTLPSDASHQRSRFSPFLRNRKCLLISLVLLVISIVVLVITIPVVLTRHGKTSTSIPELSFMNGAYNGSGIALLQLGKSNIDYSYHIYYQHSTGEIRDLELKNYQWVPAAYTNVGLPTSVRNGTPMAVASYENSEPWPTYHIFYIDSSGILQEIFNTGGNGDWQSGTLGTLNIKPSTSLSVGLTACSNERFDGANMTASEQKFELYYGGDDNLVHELQYNFGSLTWSTQATFVNTNGNAGIECSASDPNLSYVFLSNIENKLELWWKDDNKNATNSTKRPVGVWRKVPSPAPPTIHPNSSISRIRTSDTANILFFQDPSYAVKALQPNVAAENSTWGSLINVGSAVAAPGSHMAATTFFQGNFSNQPNLGETEIQAERGFHLILQQSGNDLTEYVRSYIGGQWTSDSIPNL